MLIVILPLNIYLNKCLSHKTATSLYVTSTSVIIKYSPVYRTYEPRSSSPRISPLLVNESAQWFHIHILVVQRPVHTTT